MSVKLLALASLMGAATAELKLTASDQLTSLYRGPKGWYAFTLNHCSCLLRPSAHAVDRAMNTLATGYAVITVPTAGGGRMLEDAEY